MKKISLLTLVLLMGGESQQLFGMEAPTLLLTNHPKKKKRQRNRKRAQQTPINLNYDWQSDTRLDLSKESEKNLAHMMMGIYGITASAQPTAETTEKLKHSRNVYDALIKVVGSKRITKEKYPVLEDYSDEETKSKAIIECNGDLEKLTALNIPYFTENSSLWKDNVYEGNKKKQALIKTLDAKISESDAKCAQLRKKIEALEKEEATELEKIKYNAKAHSRQTEKRQSYRFLSEEIKLRLEAKIEKVTNKINTLDIELKKLNSDSRSIQNEEKIDTVEYNKKILKNAEAVKKFTEDKEKFVAQHKDLETRINHMTDFMERFDGEGSLARRLGVW